MVFVTEAFEEVEVRIAGTGNRNLDAATLLGLADSLDKHTSISPLADLTRESQGGSTSSGRSTSWRRTEEVNVHVESSREHILELACDIAFREGFSTVQWKRNFSALHFAAKFGSVEFVRRLLQEANATKGLALRDDLGKLPIDYALALAEVDLELMELLDPKTATTAQPPQQQAAKPLRKTKNGAKLPTVLEESSLDSETYPKSKGMDVGSQRRTQNRRPTLLGSRQGFARQA